MERSSLLTLFVTILIILSPDYLHAQTEANESVNQLTIIPDVRCVKTKTAKQVIHIARLKQIHGTYYISPDKWSSDINPHMIYIQSIPAKRHILVGTEIGTWEFKKAKEGQKLITVPDFRGLKIQNVLEKCKDINLTTKQILQNNSIVVNQFPKKNTKVYEGTFILFIIKTISTNQGE